MRMKSIVVITGLAAIAVVAIAVLVTLNQRAIAQQQNSGEWPIVVRIQKTVMSTGAPAVAPGQAVPHQTVFALPIRHDGKVWSGKVTFVASKPIEIEVIHKYNPTGEIDAQHG